MDDTNDEEYIEMLKDIFMREHAVDVIQGSIQFAVNKVEMPKRRVPSERVPSEHVTATEEE